jgi:hypothetical protein
MYIKITNGTPEKYTIGKLRRDNPNTSFPRIISDDTLSSYGVYSYAIQDQPSYDKRTQRLESGSFDNSSGSWVQTWNIVDKTTEEVEEYDSNMVQQVKAEAQRRIINIIPEWKQRNLTARAAELAIKGVVNWTAEETLEYEKGQAIWNSIKRIREKSDELESMSIIPIDFYDDKYWVNV